MYFIDASSQIGHSSESDEIAAYALFREELDEIYLRQLFVARHKLRRYPQATGPVGP